MLKSHVSNLKGPSIYLYNLYITFFLIDGSRDGEHIEWPKEKTYLNQWALNESIVASYVYTKYKIVMRRKSQRDHPFIIVSSNDIWLYYIIIYVKSKIGSSQYEHICEGLCCSFSRIGQRQEPKYINSSRESSRYYHDYIYIKYNI